MNRDMVKVREVRLRTNLGNGEVDGHLLTRRIIEGFEVGEQRASLGFLELSNSAAARKVEMELWNDVMEKEYPRRNYL